VKLFIVYIILVLKHLYQQEQSKCNPVMFNTSSINVSYRTIQLLKQSMRHTTTCIKWAVLSVIHIELSTTEVTNIDNTRVAIECVFLKNV